MGRLVTASCCVIASTTLLGGCTGSEPAETDTVPIASVVARFGGIGAVPDDGRGCPTTFAAKSEESENEIRLTVSSTRVDGSGACVAVPVVYLGAPVGGRPIVDTTSGRRFTLPADVGGPGAGVSVR